jgi:hypothetical protein
MPGYQQARVLGEEGQRVEAEAIDRPLKPEAHRRRDRLAHVLAAPVQVRLFRKPRHTRLAKPGMLVRGVVARPVEDHGDAGGVGTRKQPSRSASGPNARHAPVVGDVVAHVAVA